MAVSPNFISFPTLQAECHDTEARSLKKLTDLMYEFVYGQDGSSIPTTLKDLIETVKMKDVVRSTTGGFVAQYTLFDTACLLWQIDVFSIAPSTRWVYIYDTNVFSPGTIPIYIAPIYSDCSSTFTLYSPFQNGVTLAFSTAPNTMAFDGETYMFATAIKRNG